MPCPGSGQPVTRHNGLSIFVQQAQPRACCAVCWSNVLDLDQQVTIMPDHEVGQIPDASQASEPVLLKGGPAIEAVLTRRAAKIRVVGRTSDYVYHVRQASTASFVWLDLEDDLELVYLGALTTAPRLEFHRTKQSALPLLSKPVTVLRWLLRHTETATVYSLPVLRPEPQTTSIPWVEDLADEEDPFDLASLLTPAPYDETELDGGATEWVPRVLEETTA